MQVLKNILSFAGLGIGVPTSLPHGLNRGTGPATPRLIAANAPGFTITADAINVTVTRTTGGTAVSVYAELWHTYEDAEPYPGLAPTSFPFVIDANGGGGGGGSNIIVDNQGVALPGNPFTTLDFTGGGVVAANAGAGLATITIPGTVTTDGVTITGDGSTGNPLVAVAGGSAAPNPLYGLGIDGALVFDGVATVAGLAPASGVYAMTRDLYATTLTVTGAARVKTAGSAVFATVSVTVDGILDDDGNPGTLGIDGAQRGLRRFGPGTSPTGSGGSSFTWPVLFPTAPVIAGGAAGVAGGNGTSPGQGAGGGGGLGPGSPGGDLTQASGPSNVGASETSPAVGSDETAEDGSSVGP
jgi:hypothetical protein